MSTAVTINDIIPRTQATATNGQTVFNTNWTAAVASNIEVYARAAGVDADDQTQLVSSTLYNVTFIGDSETVRVTFLSGRTTGDVITIVRNTPADRLNLYTNTNFTPSMLNDDFGILDLVDQQAQLFDEELAPHYNKSCTFTDENDKAIDNILPILGANQIWAKNNANDSIITYDVPSSGGVAPKLATYLIQTSASGELPNAQVMGNLPSGLVVTRTTTGVQQTVVLTGTNHQIDISDADGLAGNPTFNIASNVILPGTQGMGIPTGTTAQRPVSPFNGQFRFNSSLLAPEYYTGTSWDQLSGGVVDTITGTANQISVDSTSPANPIIAIASNPILPGTGGETLPQGTTAQRAGAAGTMRFNTQTLEFEGTTDGATWHTFQTSAGTVLSVSGTANRITSTGGANPVIDISAAYVGQSSIDTLGTITTGTWHGTAIDLASYVSGNLAVSHLNSGTNASSTTYWRGDATWATITGSDITGAALTKTDDTNVTLSLGGSPSTALLRAASLTLGWTGQLSETRGGTAQSTYTLGDILYSSAANTLSKLAGNTTSTKKFLSQTGTGAVSAAPAWSTISGTDVTGAALTKTDDTNVTLTLGGSPTSALLNAASLTLGWTGQLSIARGGTGVASVTTSPTASAWAGWDANSNLSANAFIGGFATTASAGATTTLTVASKEIQEITGTLTQTIVMPVTSTLVAGRKWMIINNSTGVVTVNSSGGNLIVSMAANTTAWITCVLNSGTTAASWNSSYLYDLGAGVLSITGTANQVIASASTGAVTLSLPQDIATSSAVQFASLRLSNTGLLDNNNATMLTLGATASAVNFFSMTNNIAGSAPIFQVLGSDSNISLNLAGKGTGGVLVQGTGTNNSASAGYVGEYISNSATITTITANTATNLTSISLTAGDWDVYGAYTTTPAAGTTTTYSQGGINTTSATIPTPQTTGGSRAATTASGYTVPTVRVSIAATTTVYLVGLVQFAVSTMNMSGYISARRVR